MKSRIGTNRQMELTLEIHSLALLGHESGVIFQQAITNAWLTGRRPGQESGVIFQQAITNAWFRDGDRKPLTVVKCQLITHCISPRSSGGQIFTVSEQIIQLEQENQRG